MLSVDTFQESDQDEMSKWIVVLGLLCITVGGDFIDDFKNVSVNVVLFEQVERTSLKLNVSWSPPETGRTPSLYR